MSRSTILNLEQWNNYNINKSAVQHYLAFIQEADVCTDKTGYTEVHHIIPRSVDALFEYDPENLIQLSGKDHFRAHLLLLDCFNSTNKSKMYYSFNIMCNSLHKNHYEITPEAYECFRATFKEICRVNNTGAKNPRYGVVLSEEERAKLRGPRPSLQGKNNPMYGVSRKGKKATMYGKKHKESSKAAIGQNSKGRIWINNGISNKFVKPEELDQYIQQGFIYKGCLMNKHK
jgi:hypothetical protein